MDSLSYLDSKMYIIYMKATINKPFTLKYYLKKIICKIVCTPVYKYNGMNTCAYTDILSQIVSKSFWPFFITHAQFSLYMGQIKCEFCTSRPNQYEYKCAGMST